MSDSASPVVDVELGEQDSYVDHRSKELRLEVFGIRLHTLCPSERGQMVALASMTIFCSIAFAAIQEGVLYVPGFKYTNFMSTLTLATYALCGAIDTLRSGDYVRKGSMPDYIKVSILTMGGMCLTNFSLRFLSYPLRVVFKSSRLIPVMLISVCYLGKRYTAAQYLSVALLTSGVVLFTLGDAKGKAVFDARGLVIILAGSIADAAAANFEEKRLFRQLGCPAAEVMLYASLLGCAWSAILELASGELLPALRHSRDHFETPALICLAAIMGYMSMTGVLVLIKHYGATVAELVKSGRKVMTICTSFVVYGKPWSLFHVWGGLLFTASVCVERYAAGGGSRRFARVLAGVALVISLILFRTVQSRTCYSIIIDAGTTATHLHIFRFDDWTLNILDINGSAEVHQDVMPGLRDFARNPNGIAATWLPLLETALATVPKAKRADTALAVRANSGLLLLPNDEAELLLEAVRAFVQPFGFLDAGVELLDGAEEAEGSWLTVNFLMGAFRPGVQRVHNPYVVLDMRGVSLQYAHFVREDDWRRARDHIGSGSFVRRLKLPYGSGIAHIYRHSYLGYGLMEARSRSIELLRDGVGADRQEVAQRLSHPCFSTGQLLPSNNGSKELGVVGGTNTSACEGLVVRLLRLDRPCGDEALQASGRCTFDGVWAAPSSGQRVALLSYFFDRLADAGVIHQRSGAADVTPLDYSLAAQNACSSPAVVPSGLAPELAMWMCFDLTYLSLLLQRGMRLGPTQTVTVVKTVDYHNHSFEAAWALGLAIERLAS